MSDIADATIDATNLVSYLTLFPGKLSHVRNINRCCNKILNKYRRGTSAFKVCFKKVFILLLSARYERRINASEICNIGSNFDQIRDPCSMEWEKNGLTCWYNYPAKQFVVVRDEDHTIGYRFNDTSLNSIIIVTSKVLKLKRITYSDVMTAFVSLNFNTKSVANRLATLMADKVLGN